MICVLLILGITYAHKAYSISKKRTVHWNMGGRQPPTHFTFCHFPLPWWSKTEGSANHELPGNQKSKPKKHQGIIYGCFNPKIGVKTPQIIPWLIGFSMKFSPSILGVLPLFLETPISFLYFFVRHCLRPLHMLYHVVIFVGTVIRNCCSAPSWYMVNPCRPRIDDTKTSLTWCQVRRCFQSPLWSDCWTQKCHLAPAPEEDSTVGLVGELQAVYLTWPVAKL